MKSDFDLIIHRLPECKEAKLYFVGDLHAGAVEANIKWWEAFVQKILQEKNSYICLMGDLMNNATRSSVSNVFDDIMRQREQKRYLANALAPLSERILCAVSGNHEARSGKDADDSPMFDIMAKLDLEDLFRENAAFIKLGFGSRDDGKNHEKPLQVYTVCCTHGAGGGIYTGAAVNRNERMAMFVNADILAVGHTTKEYYDEVYTYFEKEVCGFLSDDEKMHDFFRISKKEFLSSYSYLTEEEYDMTVKEIKEWLKKVEEE